MPRIETANDVLELRNEWRQFWEPSKLLMDKGYRWYNGDVAIYTPRGVAQNPPPTATSLVNDAADHLTGDDPFFTVRAVKETQTAGKDRERVEYALNSLFNVVGHQEGNALHRAMAMHGGWSGMMCCFLGVKEGWDVDDPDADDLYWLPRDPRHVYPDPGSLGRDGVIFSMQRSVGEIRKNWPDWEGYWFPAESVYETGDVAQSGQDPFLGRKRLDQRLPDTAMVDWTEYWDDKVKCFIANGVPVFVDSSYGSEVVEHGLGINPWIIRASGYGISTGEPDKIFKSILQPVFHLLDEEARVWNQWKWIIEDTAWPALILPASMAGFNATPGEYNYAEDPEDIKAVRSIRNDQVKPDAIIATMGWIQEQIERATYPVILKGQAPGGIRAGYPIAILTTQAKLKFAAPTAALKDALRELCEKTLAVVKNRIDAEVTVIEDYVLKADDYDKYVGRISVSLEPRLPTDLAAKLPILEFFIGSLGGSKAYAARELGIDDPEELRELRMVEDLEDDPRVKQAMAESLIQDMLPEYQGAVGSILGPNVEIQNLQQQFQQVQGQVQMLTALLQERQLTQQLQGALQPQAQAGPPVPGGPPQAPQVPGGAGGTQFGQNLFNPNQMGQSRQEVNPDTQMAAIARNLRANRTMEEMGAQNTLFGNAGLNLGV